MPTPTRWMREGYITGLTAWAAVAVFYGGFDLFAGRGALFTVDQLGRFLLQGTAESAVASGPAPMDVTGVLAYTALHLVASLAIGMLVCRLVHEAEMEPWQAQVALLFIVAGFAGTITVVGLLSAPIRSVLPWWSIVVANTLAVLVAGSVMIRRHPGFLSRMTVAPR
jgi:hypothetical protein